MDLIAAADEARAEGRTDDEIDLRLRAFAGAAEPRAIAELEQIELAAHAICDLADDLLDPTSAGAFRAATRHADRRFEIIEQAMIALVRAEQPERALTLSQRVKSPALVRRLRAHAAARPDLSPLGARYRDLLRAESTARSALREEQRRGAPVTDTPARVAEIDALRDERRDVERELRRARPEELVSLGGALDAATLFTAFPPDAGAAWVDLFFTSEGTILLLLARRDRGMVIESVLHDGFTLADLRAAADAWTSAARTVEAAGAALRTLGRVLHDRLLCGLDFMLRRRRHWQITFIPHLDAHALPLHASPLCDGREDQECLGDRFAISVAPCLQLAFTTALRARPEAFSRGALPAHLFADPTEDLPAARREQRAVAERLAHHPWPSPPVPSVSVVGADVTIDAVEQAIESAPLVVLSCHARFAAKDSFGSGLVLAGPNGGAASWTVDRIFTRPWLRGSPIVVLSACESGMSGFDESAEIVALPPALVTIGAAAVVATLWPVEDLAASFLAERFAHHLADPGDGPAAALGRAARDLRRLTREEAITRCDEILEDLESRGVQFSTGQEAYVNVSAARQRLESGPPCPFASPFYWGAFFVMGCGWRLIAGRGEQARPESALPLAKAAAGVKTAMLLMRDGAYAQAEALVRELIPHLGGLWLARALLVLGDSLVSTMPAAGARERLAEAQTTLRRAHELLVAEGETQSAEYCAGLLATCADIERTAARLDQAGRDIDA